MNWIKKFLKYGPANQSNQFLYYVRSELLGKYFAVVRVTWRDSSGICCISETRIEKSDIDVIKEMHELLYMALSLGSNVCVICNEDPKHLGIHET
jgi:hypothetical protein